MVGKRDLALLLRSLGPGWDQQVLIHHYTNIDVNTIAIKRKDTLPISLDIKIRNCLKNL